MEGRESAQWARLRLAVSPHAAMTSAWLDTSLTREQFHPESILTQPGAGVRMLTNAVLYLSY